MRPFVHEMEELQKSLLEMGGLVETSIHNSIRSLVENDRTRAWQVSDSEPQINRLEIRIDETATRLLALFQPVARDLRFVTAALKINKDLERMGDLALNIARYATDHVQSPLGTGLLEIPRMSKTVEAMVRGSLDAFVRRDEALARRVLLSDDDVDDLKESVYRELLGILDYRPELARPAFDLIFIAHNLERMADHATNIAEDVTFMITGHDVRHHHAA